MTRLILKFVYAATADLSTGIDFFEQDEVQVHCAQEKMRDLLYQQMSKVVVEEKLKNLDDEGNDDTFSKKSGRELLQVAITPEVLLSEKKMFVGNEVQKDIKDLGLTPTSPQLSWLMKMVQTFHTTVATNMQKYFETALKSEAMVSMSGLAPGKHNHVLTTRKLKTLVNKYSKVVDNIQLQGGMDKVKWEIEQYSLDEDVGDLKETSFEDFWLAVAELKDGVWQKYEVLPRFALAMGAKFNDTSAVERKFSDMNLLHQNKQRNRMSQELLGAHLHVKHGVESKENRKNCTKCQQGIKTQHCHCDKVKIDEEMRRRCKKAYLAIADRRESAKDLAKAEEAQFQTRAEKTKREEKERLAKFREELKKKPSFYSEKVMSTRIYEKEKNKSEESSSKRSFKESNKKKISSVDQQKGSSVENRKSKEGPKRVIDGGQGSGSSGSIFKKKKFGAN